MSALCKVVTAKWRSVPHFRYGKLHGSKTVWDLMLECGHSVTVADRTNGRLHPQPIKARCNECPPPSTERKDKP